VCKLKKNIRIGVVVGLEREKKLLKKFPDLIIGQGYGKNATQATKKVLSRKVDVILSFGFAGSLTKKIRNGDIVFPKKIYCEKGSSNKTSNKFSNYFLKKLKHLQIKRQNLLTVSKIIHGKKEKNHIFLKCKKKISLIDMESAIIQKQALIQKIPFLSARVIFDDISFNIPKFLTDSIDENGNLIIGILIRNLVKKPSRINDLITHLVKFNKAKKVLQNLFNNLFTKS